jgi:hypothetical protein
MTKYLLLYISPVSAQDQMANASPEEGQAGMEAWNAWAGRAGSAIVDFGSPVQATGTVGATGGGAGGDREHVGGFSILEADSADALRGLLEDHPHLMLDGASIEFFELLELPGGP